jgi:hypothetical protein
MNVTAILRWIVLALSAGAMAVGVGVMAGMLVPTAIPGQFRIPAGVVVFLYGAYRFVITLVRGMEARRNETQ